MSHNLTIIVTIGASLIAIVLYYLVKSFTDERNMRNGADLFISPENIFEQVRLSIANGNHVAAQKLAKKYLAENPTHDTLRFLLARSYYETGNTHEAIPHLELIIKEFPEKKDYALMLADSYSRIGNNSSAIDTYLRILDYNAMDVEVLNLLAELYLNIHHKKSALNIYKRLLNMDLSETTKLKYYIQMATIYKEMNEYTNALEYTTFALNVDKNNISLLYLLKDLYRATNNKPKEIEVMNQLLLLAPTDAHLQLDLINLYYQNEQYEEAIDIAVPALKTPNADIEALQNIIASIYIKTNRIEEGIGILETVINLYPHSIRITETLAKAYQLTNEYKKSIELYTHLIEMSDIKTADLYRDEMSSVYSEWALYEYSFGSSKQVFTKFDEALKLNPDNPDIYEGLAQVNFLTKNYNDAIRQMQKAISLAPGKIASYLYLAHIYEELNNIYEAERMYKEAIYIDPENTACHAQLGNIYLKQKEITQAMNHLSIAVRNEPNNWDYLYHLALGYELSGDNDSAIEAYNMVLTLNPSHVEAAKNLKMIENII